MKKRRTIGKAAAEIGISVETVRFYERIGLIDQPQSTSGPRHYDDLTVARLRYIKIAQQLGLSLKEIAALTSRLNEGKQFCAALRATVEAKIASVKLERTRLDTLESELVAFLLRCKTHSPEHDCPIVRELTDLSYGLEKVNART
jgi:DNA-binding transcriptional MerR regulator